MTSLGSLMLCLTVGCTGCHSLGIYTAEEKAVQAAEFQRASEEMQVREKARRIEARKRAAEAEKLAAEEAEYDRLCLDPQTTYQQNWCLERQRRKDRQYAEELRRAEWAHQEQMEQQRQQFDRELARREAIRRAFDTPAPAPQRSINCRTTPDYMGGSRTTCD
jgi:hypothetical protein